MESLLGKSVHGSYGNIRSYEAEKEITTVQISALEALGKVIDLFDKGAPNVRFREACGMVFVNRDKLMTNAIKPSVQHVVAVANFIGANTEQTLQVEQTDGVSLCGMVFVNRDQLMDNANKPSVQHANTEITSELQYFG